MDPKKDPAENSIVDLIDDNEYHEYKKSKQQADNATWAIYIFTTVSFLFYVIHLLIFHAFFFWPDLAINMVIFIVYLFLGSYSNSKPFTAIIAMLSVLAIVISMDVLLSYDFALSPVVIKMIVAVYIAMRLDTAKRVQDYEKRYPKK